MKINIIPRLMDAVSSGKSFEEQLASAEASGRPFGRVSDALFGKHIIYNTDEEIADAKASAEVKKENPIMPTLEERIAVIERKLL